MACQSFTVLRGSACAASGSHSPSPYYRCSQSSVISHHLWDGLRVQPGSLRTGLWSRTEGWMAPWNQTAWSTVPSMRADIVRCAMTPLKEDAQVATKRSKVELIKEKSNFLRHPLMEELLTDKPNINEEAAQLMKFHGSYQQDNRYVKLPDGGKSYQFMMRTRQPAGKVTNRVYIVMDDLSNQYGNGTLRLTTRQTFQMHGILKENLKTVFSTVVRNMGSTLGACGDLNRNVLSPPAPYTNRPEYLYAEELAEKIAHLFAPQAGAYYDVWVDGEKVATAEEPADVVAARNRSVNGQNIDNSAEPIYGTQYLPRKFKMAVTVPGDNSVDILTNDVGVVVICNAAGELEGYNIYVGGGMGRSHRNEDTFPRLADPLGYVPKEDILYALKSIVATQRDHGRRDDRKQARMKYLIESWGIDRFREKVESYYGKKFEEFRDLPPWQFQSYLGWHEQGDGLYFCGVHIENGRLKGDKKETLRNIIEKYDLPIRITANQNLILCDIRKSWQSDIKKALTECGLVPHRKVDALNITAMACPALPLCGLAIAEAERGLPDVLLRLRALMKKVGLTSKDTMVVRMTGCPNGCARPYVAELGFVGDGPNSYQVWLGGSPNQTRLAQVFMEKVKLQDIEKRLQPILVMWKKQRLEGEAFGDFTIRVGFEKIRIAVENFDQPDVRSPVSIMVKVDSNTYSKLKEIASNTKTRVEDVAKSMIESASTM